MTKLSFKRCFAVGCHKTIERHLLMCRDHWVRVPARVREEVGRTWAAFERGRGDRRTLKHYLLATLRAQLAVAEQEGKRDPAKAIRETITHIEVKEAQHP